MSFHHMYTRRTSDIRYNDDDDDVVVLPPAVKQPPLVIDIDSDEEDDYRRVFKSHRQYRMKTVPTSGRITQRSTVTHRPVAHSHTKQEYLSSSTTIGPTIWTDRKVRFINTVNGGASIIKQDEFAPIRISTSIFHDDDDEPSNESVPVENPSSTFTSLPSYPFQIPMTNSYEIEAHKTQPIILIPRSISPSPYRSFTPNVPTPTPSSSQGQLQQCTQNDHNNNPADWQQQVRRVNFNTLEPVSYGLCPPTWNPTNSVSQSYNMYNTPRRDRHEMQPPSFTEDRPKQKIIHNDKCTINIHLTSPELNVLLPEMNKKGGIILELTDRFKVNIFLSLTDKLIVIERGVDTDRELVMNQILHWLPYQLSRRGSHSTRFSPPETMQQFQNWQSTSVQQSTRESETAETKPSEDDLGGRKYTGFIPTPVYSVPNNLNTKQSWLSKRKVDSKLLLPSHTNKMHRQHKRHFKHKHNHGKKKKQQPRHGMGFHPPQGARNGGGHLKFVRSTHPTDLRMGRAKIKSEK